MVIGESLISKRFLDKLIEKLYEHKCIHTETKNLDMKRLKYIFMVNKINVDVFNIVLTSFTQAYDTGDDAQRKKNNIILDAFFD